MTQLRAIDAGPPEDDVPHPAGAGRVPLPSCRILAADASALELAGVCLRELGTDPEGRQTIVRWAGQWWRWTDGHHRVLSDEETRSLIWNTLARVDVEKIDDEGQPRRERLAVTARRVSEVADAMISLTDRIAAAEALPCALPGYTGPHPHRVVVVRNGLLELETMRLHRPNPRLFATAGAGVEYQPSATCASWRQFIEQVFTDENGPDLETIRLVQQIFGWMISGDCSRHVIPLFVGPPRSGKSTMMNILRELLGVGNVCAPPLATLGESRFGLAPLLGKTAALIPDARLGSRADQAAVAGLLLAASGQDVISIERKGRDAVEARLRCRIAIVTNELPRIGDSSGALASRFLVVETRRSFLGREDLGLEERLRSELPGILLWSLEGWRDLSSSGWVRPARMQEVLDELDRLGSPVKAFAADRLVFTAGAETSLEVLYREWGTWCDDCGRKEHGNVQLFARDFRAAFPGVRKVRKRGDSGESRIVMYVGVGIRSGRTS